MTKNEFVDMVVKNHSTNRWLSGWFEVEGKKVAVKSFGKWVQRMHLDGGVVYSTAEVRTVGAFKFEVMKIVELILED